MTRDAEMGARHFVDLVLATLPGETDSTLLRTLHRPAADARCSCYTAPEHREATRTATRDRLWEHRRARPSRAATPSSSSSARRARSTTAGDDTAYARGLLDGTEVARRARRSTSRCAGRCSRRSSPPAPRTWTRSSPSGRARTPRPGRERAARARAARPTAEAKEEAWAVGRRGHGLPNAVVDAVAHGLHPPGHAARAAATRSSSATTRCSTRSRSAGSHAIVESIVHGFYPRPLVDRTLLEATQSWLDATPTRHAALRRLVVENRDPIARALAAQERDARD